MKNYKKIILVFISILLNQVIFAQNVRQETLKETLLEVEKVFDVKFSYSEKRIDSKKITIDLEGKSLKEILLEIETQTTFFIKKITNRYYSISSISNKKITICGYIFDAETKKPLENVSINTKNKTVITNDDGFFELKKIRTSDSIQIAHIGYEKEEIGIKEMELSECKNIYIHESINILNEVLITNYLAKGIIKKSNGAIILRPKDQGVLPGLTDADVLYSVQKIPGIESPLETASGTHIHGGTSDQNLILFDGIKLYNTAHFFGAISAFNPYSIDNVDVYKSASNAKYGNHISGVIDIQTIDRIPEKRKIEAGVSLTNADVFTRIPITEKIGVQFSVRRSLSDIIETITYEKLSTKVFQNTIVSEGEELAIAPNIESDNDVNFVDVNSKVIYEIDEKNKVSLQQISIQNKLEFQLENIEINDVRNDQLKIENNGYGISWNKEWNSSLKQNINVYYSDYNFSYDGEKRREENIYDFTIKENRIKDLTTSILFEQKLDDRNYMNFGYEYAYNDVAFDLKKKNEVLFYGTEKKEENVNNVHALLWEYIYDYGGKYYLQAGLRSNYVSQLDKTLFEPRIFAKVKIIPSLWGNMSLEIKNQYTSKIIEFFTSDFGLENELWTLSNNEDIPILKSKQISTGLFFDKNNWLLDIELYYKKIDGLTSLTTGFNNLNKAVFNGNAIIKGLDILLQKKWNSKFNTWISYTFNDTNLLFEGFNESERFQGNFNISNTLYIAQEFKLNDWDFSMGWNYRTGLPFNSLVEINPNNGLEIERYNNANLPSYHRLDISTTYNFFWNKEKTIKSKIGVSFLNIYDRRNVLKRMNEVVFDNEFNASLNTIEIYSLGFTPNVVFRVKF